MKTISKSNIVAVLAFGALTLGTIAAPANADGRRDQPMQQQQNHNFGDRGSTLNYDRRNEPVSAEGNRYDQFGHYKFNPTDKGQDNDRRDNDRRDFENRDRDDHNRDRDRERDNDNRGFSFFGIQIRL